MHSRPACLVFREFGAHLGPRNRHAQASLCECRHLENLAADADRFFAEYGLFRQSASLLSCCDGCGPQRPAPPTQAVPQQGRCSSRMDQSAPSDVEFSWPSATVPHVHVSMGGRLSLLRRWRIVDAPRERFGSAGSRTQAGTTRRFRRGRRRSVPGHRVHGCLAGVPNGLRKAGLKE